MQSPSRNHRTPSLRRSGLATLLRGGVGLGAILVALPWNAGAEPRTPTVAKGDVTIAPFDGRLTQVTQTSTRAVVEWDSFNLVTGETIDFRQPSSSAVILNRVTGSTSSSIAGNITANGRVFLLNPHGILVTQGASIDVNSLVLSTASIDTDAFMGGQYSFTGAGARTSVVNEGTILADPSGFVALVGAEVSNKGTITAQLGTVALAAAPGFTLDFVGDGLISFDVTGALDASAVGILQPALVDNSGTIRANGGTVVMTAAQASRLLDNAISLGGVVEATSIGTRAGAIVLEAPVGNVTVTGKVAALGDNVGEKGGSISAAGDKIILAGGSELNVNGDGGGGTVRIGGSTAPVQSIDVASNAILRADATRAGAGGAITLAAEGALAYAGQSSATGVGATVGRGGSVTLSAGGRAVVTGSVTATGTATGTWRLTTGGDLRVASANPDQADLSFVSTATVQGALNAVTSVSLVTPGDLSVTSPITRTLGSVALRPTLDLTAGGNVTVNSGALIRGSVGRGFNLSLNANSAGVTGDADPLAGNVQVDAAVSTFGGFFSSSGVDFANNVGIGTNGGAITLQHGGVARIGSGLSTTGTVAGNLKLAAARGVLLAGPLTTSNGAIELTGPVTLAADTTLAAGTGNITIDGTVNGAHSLTLNSAGATVLQQAVGSTQALSALTTDGEGTLVARSVHTTGAQTYADAGITLDGTYSTANQPFTASGRVTTSDGTTIATTGGGLTLGPVVGRGTLTLNSGGGLLTLGGMEGVTNLDIGAVGAVRLNAGSYERAGGAAFTFTSTTVAGDLVFRSTASLGTVTLAGDAGITGQGTTVTTADIAGAGHGLFLGGHVDVTGNVQAASLTLTGDGAQVTIAKGLQAGALTGTGNTLDLTLLGGVDIAGAVTLGPQTQLSTAGTWTMGGGTTFGSLRLLGDLTLRGAGDITIAGLVQGKAALDMSGLAISFLRPVGIAEPPDTTDVRLTTARIVGTSLSMVGLKTTDGQTLEAGRITLAGDYQSSAGGFTATGPVQLSADTVLSIDKDITFHNAISGPGGLRATTAAGNAWFKGDIGADGGLAHLSVTGPQGIRLGGAGQAVTVGIIGNGDFGGNLVLESDVTVNAPSTLFQGGVTSVAGGGQGLTVNGAARFNGPVALGGAFTVSGDTTFQTASVATGQGQSYSNVTLQSTIAFTAGAGDILFNGAIVGGGHDLKATADKGSIAVKGQVGSGSVDFRAVSITANGIGTARDQTLTAGHLHLSGDYRAGGNIVWSGATTLSGPVIVDADGDARATGGIVAEASLAVEAGGNIVWSGAATLAGPVTLSAGNDVQATGGIDAGASLAMQAGRDISLSGAATVAGSATLHAGNDVQATGGIDAGASLTVQAGRDISLSGTATLTGPATLSAGNDVQVTGDIEAQTSLTVQAGRDIGLSGVLTLSGPATLHAGGDLRVSGSIDAGPAGATLVAQAAGDIHLAASVGAGTALSELGLTGRSLLLGTGGTGYVRTTGGQTYTGAITLSGDTLLVAGGDIAMAGTVDSAAGSARHLVVNATGTTLFSADVGASGALAGLRTDADAGRVGNLTISAADAAMRGGVTRLGSGQADAAMQVVTMAGQFHGDGVELAADTRLSAGGGLGLAATLKGDRVDANRDLVIDAKGDAAFAQGVSQLASLRADATGTLRLNGVATAGAQTYGAATTILSGGFTGGSLAVTGPAQLAGATSVDMGGGAVRFGGTVQAGAGVADSTFNVVGGAVEFVGTIGGIDGAARLTALDVRGNRVTAGGDIFTRGLLTVNGVTGINLSGGQYVAGEGALTLTGPILLSASGTRTTTRIAAGGDIRLDGTLDGATALTLERMGSGNHGLHIGGAVGAGTPLASITTGTGLLVTLAGAGVRTSGDQTWGGGVALNRDVVLETVTKANVTFRGNIWSAATSAATLSVKGAANVTFKGNVGVSPAGEGALRSLTIDATETLLDPDDKAAHQIIRTVRTVPGTLGPSARDRGDMDGAQVYSGTVRILGAGATFSTTGVAITGTSQPSVLQAGMPGGNLIFQQMIGEKATAIWLLGGNGGAYHITAGETPVIDLDALTVAGQKGSAQVRGKLDTLTGEVAAQKVDKVGGRSNEYRLNGCAMGNPTCVVTNYSAPPVPETVSIPAFPVAERVIRFDPTGVIRGNEDLWPDRADDDEKKGTAP